MEFTNRKRIFAALLSVVVPGSGQILKREHKKAAIYLAIFAVVLLLCWPARIAETYAGLLVVKIGAICLALVASLDAWLTGEGSRPRYAIILLVLAAIGLGDLPTGLILRAEGFHRYYVPASSMEPSVMQGDLVVADKHYYEAQDPQCGDVVLLHFNVLMMKRVVAVEGDEIQGLGEQVWLNGQLLQEPYVQHVGGPTSGRLTFGPIRVLPGKVFLMGDNRDVSLDSRDPRFGQISTRGIMGKILYVFKSKVPGRWGRKIG
jgi:signal peptidase I